MHTTEKMQSSLSETACVSAVRSPPRPQVAAVAPRRSSPPSRRQKTAPGRLCGQSSKTKLKSGKSWHTWGQTSAAGVDFKAKHPRCVLKGLTTRRPCCSPCSQQQFGYQVVVGHKKQVAESAAEVAAVQLCDKIFNYCAIFQYDARHTSRLRSAVVDVLATGTKELQSALVGFVRQTHLNK